MQESQNDFEAYLDPPPDLTGKIQAVLGTPVPARERPEDTITRTQKLLNALGVPHGISSLADDEDEGGPDGEGF